MLLAVVAEAAVHPGNLLFSRRGTPAGTSSCEMWILGKVTQLLTSGAGESGMWREAQSATESGRELGIKGIPTNGGKPIMEDPGRFLSQTLTTALGQSRLDKHKEI